MTNTEQVIEATDEKISKWLLNIPATAKWFDDYRAVEVTGADLHLYAHNHTRLVSELERVKAEKEKYREAADHALQLLRESHIQNNKYRMGAFGSSDIDSAIERLAEALADKEEKIDE